MYVEDNADVRNLVLELIESEGRRVLACADAEAAWAQLQREVFDVLVTDVNLPGWSGIELARRWLEGGAVRWVILLSGYDFGPAWPTWAAMCARFRKKISSNSTGCWPRLESS